MTNTPIEAVKAGMAFYGDALPHLDRRKLAPMWHLFTLGHIVAVDLDRIARKFELSLADVHLLGTVRIVRHGPIRATDLAQILDVSQAALSSRINQLVGAGLLIKKQRRTDKRAFELAVTDRGLEVADAAVQAFASSSEIARALGKLSPSDLATFTRIISGLHEELDRAIASGIPGKA